MDEQTKQRLDGLAARLAGVELRVEKIDRLVYKLFKRIPRERPTGDKAAA